MNFDREWTQFALDAEIEHYGTSRIVAAHNALLAEVKRLCSPAPPEASGGPGVGVHAADWMAAEEMRRDWFGSTGLNPNEDRQSLRDLWRLLAIVDKFRLALALQSAALAERERVIEGLKAENARLRRGNSSIDEALNMGDGSYKP